jgi:hypothetical protein
MKKTLISLFLFLLPFVSNAGGGWTLNKKGYFFQLSYSRLYSKNFYFKNGNHSKTNEFQFQSYNFYGEYGLSNRLNIILNAPLYKTMAFPTTEKVQGIGDILVEVKYQILQGKFPLSISLGGEVPIGNENARGELKSNPSIQGQLFPLGDGEWNFWAKSYLSKSFLKDKAFFSLENAINLRTQDFSPQFYSVFQVGYKVAKPVWLMSSVKRFGKIGKSDENLSNQEGSFLKGEGVKYWSYEVSAMYEFKEKIGISFKYSNLFGDRANVYSDGLFSIGIHLKKK